MAGKWTVAAICGGILFISLAILIYTCFTSHQACDPKGKSVPSEGTESSEIGKISSEISIFTAADENSVTVTPSARTSILFTTNSSSISPTTGPSSVPFLLTLPYKPITNTTSNDSPSNPHLVPATIQNSSSVVLTRLSTVPHAPGSVWETTPSPHNSWKNISTSSIPSESNSPSITAYNSSLVIISLPSSSSSSSSSPPPPPPFYKSTLAYAPIPYNSGSNLKNEETPINSSEDGKFSTKPSTMFLGKENTSTTSRLISILTSGVSLDSSQTERASASSERTTSEVTSTILYPVTFGLDLADKIIHTPAKCPTGYKKFEGKCRPKWGKTDTIDDESDALS